MAYCTEKALYFLKQLNGVTATDKHIQTKD
jgi:hypothetical protein